jgi:predicted transcriptional regulator
MQDKNWMRSTIRKTAALSILGSLETRMMEILWIRREASAGEVYDVLRKDRNMALTTVSGTFNRLYEEGLLHREVGREKEA